MKGDAFGAIAVILSPMAVLSFTLVWSPSWQAEQFSLSVGLVYLVLSLGSYLPCWWERAALQPPALPGSTQGRWALGLELSRFSPGQQSSAGYQSPQAV